MMMRVWEQGIQRWWQHGWQRELQRGRHLQPGCQGLDLGIDLGNGAILGPEDVLESHFQRLARARRRAQAASLRPRTVPVQVGDNLVAAITVLAPQLAPLTELAEDVADTVGPVRPGRQFRDSLHHALEETHRQHAAQRVLGTRNRVSYRFATRKRPLIVTAIAAMCSLLVVGGLLWWNRGVFTARDAEVQTEE